MATETPNSAPPKKGGGIKAGVVWLLVAGIAVGGGASVPWILGGTARDAHSQKKPDAAKSKQTALPFDNVVVNIGDERLNRFLRVKLMVAVEEADAREVGDLLTKQKAFLKSWLIGYLSDQAIQDVIRKVGVNRVRREIRDHFNLMLFPDADEKIVDILVDEFHLQ
jgi:flagellar FliL protein